MRSLLLLAALIVALHSGRVLAQTELTDPAAYAEAQRAEDESLYQGTVKATRADGTQITLWVDRVVLPNGGSLTFAPPRTKTLRMSRETMLRTADASGLRATLADLVPGALVSILTQPLPKREDQATARAVLLRLDGGEILPKSLLKPWNTKSSWEFNFNDRSAPGSKVTLENNALKITVGGSPVREWHAQLFQNVEITSRKTYTLRFRARAETKHFLTVGSEVEGSLPYQNLGLLETVLLTPRWQTFQWTFTALDATPGKNRLPVFSAGHRGGVVYLADVALAPGEVRLPPSLQAALTARERDAEAGKNILPEANDADAWFLFSSMQARGSLGQAKGPGGGPVLGVRVTAASTEPWHLILMRPSLHLEEGREYTLRFLARADRGREIDVQSQVSKGDFHNIGLSGKITLGTDWKPYTMTFTARNTLPDHSRVPQFCLGASEGQVWIANVSLVRSK